MKQSSIQEKNLNETTSEPISYFNNPKDHEHLFTKIVIPSKCINIDLVDINDLKLSEHFKCPICTELIDSPITCTNCSCLFGEVCLESWLKNGSKSCPFGCPKFIKKDKTDHNLIKILNEIIVTCGNENCNEMISKENYFLHMNNCENIDYKCCAKDCKITGTKTTTAYHSLFECDLTTLKCKFCKKRILAKNHKDHLISCKSKPVNYTADCLIESYMKEFSFGNDEKVTKEAKEKKNIDVVLCNFCNEFISKKKFLSHKSNKEECKANFENKIQLQVARTIKAHEKKASVFQNSIILLFLVFSIITGYISYNFKDNYDKCDNFLDIETDYYYPDISNINDLSLRRLMLFKRGLWNENKENILVFNQTAFLFNNLIRLLTRYNNDYFEDIVEKVEYETNVYESLNLALDAFSQGNRTVSKFDIFINKYNKILKIEDSNNIFGETYINLNKLESAKHLFEKSISDNKDYWPAMLNLGITYNKQGNNIKALKWLNRTMAINNSTSKLYFAFGCTYLDSNRYQLSISSLEKAIALGLKSKTVYFKLGMANYYNKSYNESINNFKQSLELEKSKEYLYFSLCKTYLNLNDYEEAEKSIKQALALFPKEKRYLKYAGMVMEKQNKFEEAEYYFQKALEVDKKYYSALYHLSNVYTKLNRIQEALKILRDENVLKYIENRPLV